MKTRTQSMLDVIRVVVLLGYIGAIIHAARIIIPYIIGFVSDKLYGMGKIKEKFIADTGTGLDHLKDTHLFPYISLMAFVIVIAIIQVQIWENLKNILDEINFNTPFSMKVAKMIQKMSYIVLSLGLAFIAADFYLSVLTDVIPGIDKGLFKSAFQFLLAAGIIYVIGQVFKRGVELQEENELTV